MRIAVFCGSAKGKDKVYGKVAIQLARLFLEHKIGLVYGGGSIGLMGIMANEMMPAGGEVVGVIPKRIFDWEVGHEGITKLYVVDSMHERKAKMANMSDAFIIMPGGIGTLDEFMEIYTWQQLGYHQKPIGLLNTNHYFDKLISMMDNMVSEGFLNSETRKRLIIKNQPEDIVQSVIGLIR